MYKGDDIATSRSYTSESDYSNSLVTRGY